MVVMWHVDYKMIGYKPSIMGSSIVVATRRALQIEPYWSDDLIPLLSHSFSELQMCFDDLWRYTYTYALRIDRVHVLNVSVSVCMISLFVTRFPHDAARCK